jgi:hypothetical protein
MGAEMVKVRPWTKQEIETLKSLMRKRMKMSLIASKLKRTYGATRKKASLMGVTRSR